MKTIFLGLLLATLSPTALAFSCYVGPGVGFLFPQEIDEVGLIRLDGRETPVFCEGQPKANCQIEDDGGRFEFTVEGKTAKLRPREGLLSDRLVGLPALSLIDPTACRRLFPHQNRVNF